MQGKNHQAKIFLQGISHQTAPLEVREKLALSKDQIGALYQYLDDTVGLKECLVLNTCNRIEIYGLAEESVGSDWFLQQFDRFTHLDKDWFRDFGYWKSGFDTVHHLFEVAAGLDSQRIGETEIFGQVKSSYVLGVQNKTVGPVLHKVLQKGFQAAKWARTNTAINRGQVSMGNVAVDLARRIFGNLKDSRILVAGMGEVGEMTVKALISRGVKNITVSNRSPEKAVRMADEFGGRAIPFTECPNILPETDIMITSTAAKKWIFTRQMIEKALKRRPDKPLFLIDLAVPRDIESEVGKLSGVYLYNLDDLAEISNANLKIRQGEVEACRKALSKRSARLWKALSSNHSGSQPGDG